MSAENLNPDDSTSKQFPNQSSINQSSMFLCSDETIFSETQVNLRLYGNLPVATFGIIANILNLIIFSNRQMHQNLMNWFLLALTLSDLVLLTTNMCFLVMPVLAELSKYDLLMESYPYFLKYSYPIGLTAQTCSVYLTVFVSLHRYLVFCLPFRTQQFSRGSNVAIAICTALCFSIIVNIPRWQVIEVIHCYSQTQMKHQPKATMRQVGRLYFFLYYVSTYTVVMFLVPFFVLSAVSICIWISLHQSRKLRKRNTMDGNSTGFGHVADHKRKSSKNVERINGKLAEDEPSENHRLMQVTEANQANTQPFIQHQHRKFFPADEAQILPHPPAACHLAIPTQPSPAAANNRVGTSTGREKRERNLTLMLLAVVAVFLISNIIPFLTNIFDIYLLYAPNYEQLNISFDSANRSNEQLVMEANISGRQQLLMTIFEIAVEMGNILVSFNSASTIIIYLLFNARYRRLMGRLGTVFCQIFRFLMCKCDLCQTQHQDPPAISVRNAHLNMNNNCYNQHPIDKTEMNKFYRTPEEPKEVSAAQKTRFLSLRVTSNSNHVALNTPNQKHEARLIRLVIDEV